MKSLRMNSKGLFGSIGFRMILSVVLAISLFLLIFFFFLIPGIEKALMDKKRETIRELVNTVYSELIFIEKQITSGNLTFEEAQEEAIKHIKSLRYGPENKDYFWINDMEPRMIMHPYRSDLDGTNLSDFKDPHGKHLFVEFVKTVTDNSEGYVDYMWQWKDDANRIVPKISFVKEFKPWGWIIGTGIYVEDVNTEIFSIIKKIITIAALTLLLILVLFGYNIFLTMRAEKKKNEIEGELLEKEKQYLAFVENIPVGIYRKGQNGELILANPAFLKMLGYDSIHEINEVNFMNIYMNQKARKNMFDQIIEDGAIRNYEVEFKKKNKDVIWVSIYARVKLDSHGNVEYFDGVVEDITKRKQLEAQAKELDQRKDDFVGIASHELRTPLTSIKGYLDMILDNDFGEVNETLRPIILGIHKSSDRLLDLVNDMLDIAKLESGTIKFVNQIFDINENLSDTFFAYKNMAAEKDMKFLLHLDRSVCVNVDKNKFNQVIINLISNALKFTPIGGEVAIITKIKNNKIKIEVKDTGVGVSPENIPIIFSKFGQLNNILSDKQKGTGLGLAIVKEILIQMGSEIVLKSKPGKGSSFSFELDIHS